MTERASQVEYFAEHVARREQNDKAIAFLTMAGAELHGKDWVAPFAWDMDISPDEIRSWLAKETPLTMSDGMWPMVFKALLERRDRLNYVHDEIYSAFRDAKKKAGKWDDSIDDKPLIKPPHILI